MFTYNYTIGLNFASLMFIYITYNYSIGLNYASMIFIYVYL